MLLALVAVCTATWVVVLWAFSHARRPSQRSVLCAIAAPVSWLCAGQLTGAEHSAFAFAAAVAAPFAVCFTAGPAVLAACRRRRLRPTLAPASAQVRRARLTVRGSGRESLQAAWLWAAACRRELEVGGAGDRAALLDLHRRRCAEHRGALDELLTGVDGVGWVLESGTPTWFAVQASSRTPGRRALRGLRELGSALEQLVPEIDGAHRTCEVWLDRRGIHLLRR